MSLRFNRETKIDSELGRDARGWGVREVSAYPPSRSERRLIAFRAGPILCPMALTLRACRLLLSRCMTPAPRCLSAGASACMACIAGTYSNSTGAGPTALWRARLCTCACGVIQVRRADDFWHGLCRQSIDLKERERERDIPDARSVPSLSASSAV